MTTDVNGMTIEERIYRRLQDRSAFVSELRAELNLSTRICDRALIRLQRRGFIHRTVAGWRCVDRTVDLPRPDMAAAGKAGAAARWRGTDTPGRARNDPR